MASKRSKNGATSRKSGHQGRVTPKKAVPAVPEGLAAEAETGPVPATAVGAAGPNRAVRRQVARAAQRHGISAADAAASQAALADLSATPDESTVEAQRAKRRALFGGAVTALLVLGAVCSYVLGAVGPLAAVAAAGVGFGVAAAAFSGGNAGTSAASKGRWLALGLGLVGAVVDTLVFSSVVGTIAAAGGGVMGWLAATVAVKQFRPIPTLPAADRGLLEKVGVQLVDDSSSGMTIATTAMGAAAVTRIDVAGGDPRTNSDVMAFVARVDQVRRLLPSGAAGISFGGVCVVDGVDGIVKVGNGVYCSNLKSVRKALEAI